MRKDMGKVLTERARRGSGERNLKTRMSVKWHGEDGNYDIASKASSSAGRQYGYDKREYNTLIGPLKRYLNDQVGRVWDEVYSEMCATIKKTNAKLRRVFNCLDVATDVYLGKDGLYYEQPYGWKVNLYVDPVTGILSRQVQPEKDAPKKPLHLIVVNDYEEYKKIDNIWYHTTWGPSQFAEEIYCYVRRKYLKRSLIKKIQLGKKDLKKLGLR